MEKEGLVVMFVGGPLPAPSSKVTAVPSSSSLVGVGGWGGGIVGGASW